MQKTFLALGACLAGVSVVLGAFGAHGLKKIASVESIAIYQTGVQYQMYHALALLVLGLAGERLASNSANFAGWCFITGILLFSGSLYAITIFQTNQKIVPTAVGILTPVGGLFFIAGWVLFLLGILRK